MTSQFIVAICVVTPAITMAAAGLLHTLHRAQLGAELASQGIWAAPTTRFLARLLGPSELLIGVAVLAAAGLTIVTGKQQAAVVALAASGGVFCAFALIGVVLLWKRPGAPCACSGLETPVSWLVLARALVLILVAGIGMLQAEVLSEIQVPSTTAASGLFAGVAFGLLLWALPDAVAPPSARRAPAGGSG